MTATLINLKQVVNSTQVNSIRKRPRRNMSNDPVLFEVGDIVTHFKEDGIVGHVYSLAACESNSLVWN